jgi:hypothetical protein
MPRFTEHDAETLSPEQATALARVLDVQARWDGLLVDMGHEACDLHARQKANDAFQAALHGYAAKYRGAEIPEPTHAVPDRLALWCRVLRVVFGKAGGDAPAQVMGKVYRLADRVAARMSKEPIVRGPAEDLPAAVRELGVVIAWCDAMVTPAPIRSGTA